MRYYLKPPSLIIRGRFRVCSSGPNGGIRDCTTILNHQVSPDFSGDLLKKIEYLSMSHGFSYQTTACLLTAVSMNSLCVLSWDSLTVFITAGITHPDPVMVIPSLPSPEPGAGTINIIIIARDFSDQGLVDAVITATEAKVLALRNAGHSFAGTVTDAVLIASEGTGEVSYAGSATEIGRMIHESVLYGVEIALQQQSSSTLQKKPSFFIRSGIGGPHWIKWEREHCPYYPCHFKGQRCEFCYCPLYPCGDISLGDWIFKPGRNPVWSCTRCMVNHDQQVTRHLLRNPEASLQEIKGIYSRNR